MKSHDRRDVGNRERKFFLRQTSPRIQEQRVGNAVERAPADCFALGLRKRPHARQIEELQLVPGRARKLL